MLREEITGSSGELIISITELCSLVIFLMSKSELYLRKLLAYTGDNQYVVTWLLYRRSGNAIARFLLRILARLEHKYSFRIYPLYISSSNNRYCDQMTRLSEQESVALAANMGWEFVPMGNLISWFLPFNFPRLSLALPCDSFDQIKFALQLTEKRTFRTTPKALPIGHRIIVLGEGTGWVVSALKLSPTVTSAKIPWPSEGAISNPLFGRADSCSLFFTPPPIAFRLGIRVSTNR